VDTASITFSQNDAIDNTDSGFNLTQGLYNGGSIIAQGNFARGGGVGFNVPAGIQVMIGAASNSSLVHLTGNVAEHKRTGILRVLPGWLGFQHRGEQFAGRLRNCREPDCFPGQHGSRQCGSGGNRAVLR
jgi:hypothetical protein